MDIIEVTVDYIDRDLCEVLRKEIIKQLYHEYNTLPLNNDNGEITKVLSPYLIDKLGAIVREYYYKYLERDVLCSLTAEDYYNIYMYHV